MSLKLRECIPHQEYETLLSALQSVSTLKCNEIKADLLGHGYLLDNGQEKLIIVEHETGLEIIFVQITQLCLENKSTIDLLASISQIASIPISLVALVLQFWSMSGGMRRPENMEFRQFDKDGKLHESHFPQRAGMKPMHWMDQPNSGIAVNALAILFEKKMKLLSEIIQSLVVRVAAIEKPSSRKPSKTTRLNGKKN